MGKIYDYVINNALNSLEKEARRILQECVDERTYKHKTYNLYDSYGYGIYLHGKLAKSGYLSSSPKAIDGNKWYDEILYGREQIQKYLQGGYSPSGAIDLTIVATMPYAKVLEEAGGGVHHAYKVISMSFKKLDEIKNKYQGFVKTIKQ